MILKLKITFFIFLSLTLFAGCSTNNELVADSKITIERIHSNTARITKARLLSTHSNEVILRGEIYRRANLKGKAPGHLYVELINSKGDVFKKGKFNYKRKFGNSRSSKFNISIPVEPELINLIRISYHGLGFHMVHTNESSWVDVNADNK